MLMNVGFIQKYDYLLLFSVMLLGSDLLIFVWSEYFYIFMRR